MNEIVRVAKEERLVVICTIHQPSTKVYNGFDKIMIMSRGREAFAGDVNDAIPYFESIGYPCPEATNPAEFFLDLVNSDFSDEQAVTDILNMWEEQSPDSSSHHGRAQVADDDGEDGVTRLKRVSLSQELLIMLRRHSLMIVRDPVLYTGRCGIFLVSCLVFGFVYWKGRADEQAQAINKFWVNLWYFAVPNNMGVVAVYALNDEFKSVLRETKNGMVTGLSYVLAKSILVLPIMYIFALFALGIPLFIVQAAPREAFGIITFMFACLMFVFESLGKLSEPMTWHCLTQKLSAAECLAVWFEDPIIGMLQVRNNKYGNGPR